MPGGWGVPAPDGGNALQGRLTPAPIQDGPRQRDQRHPCQELRHVHYVFGGSATYWLYRFGPTCCRIRTSSAWTTGPLVPSVVMYCRCSCRTKARISSSDSIRGATNIRIPQSGHSGSSGPASRCSHEISTGFGFAIWSFEVGHACNSPHRALPGLLTTPLHRGIGVMASVLAYPEQR